MTAPETISVADVKAASKRMLQKQLYAIITSPADGIGPVLAHLEDHLGYQVALETAGVLFAAGPMWSDDEQTWSGEGLIIVRASSRQEAVEIADRDPMHAKGARTFNVRPWMINEGSINLRLNYSTQTFELR